MDRFTAPEAWSALISLLSINAFLLARAVFIHLCLHSMSDGERRHVMWMAQHRIASNSLSNTDKKMSAGCETRDCTDSSLFGILYWTSS